MSFDQLGLQPEYLKAVADEGYTDPSPVQLEAIGLPGNPDRAGGDQIVAMVTLIVKRPHVVRKIIGDLSNTDRVLVGLALQQIV